ncbi:hypothetical protein H4582DRAFT_2056772 [Lactarius indigo]|nr:hypothetical protein H4582DRAFT_2056772 [Lactarius indigo]
MSPELALTHAEVDYQEENIDLKIQQHLAASSEEHSDESLAAFIMATDLTRSLVYTVLGINIPVQVYLLTGVEGKPQGMMNIFIIEWSTNRILGVKEVDTDVEHTVVAGGAPPATPVWNGFSNAWSSLVTLFGSGLGSRVRCTGPDCAISAKLCLRSTLCEVGERTGKRGQVGVCLIGHVEVYLEHIWGFVLPLADQLHNLSSKHSLEWALGVRTESWMSMTRGRPIARPVSHNTRVPPWLIVHLLVTFAYMYTQLEASRDELPLLSAQNGDFTFVYPTEILAFNDELPEFSRLNTTVLGTPSLAPTRFSGTATWAMREYGCLIEDNRITFRASYLIDSKGVLRQITTNDLPVGRSIDDVLHLVQAFQFTDAHGEEGSKTICADPLAKLDKFATAIVDGALENGKASGTKRARMDTE